MKTLMKILSFALAGCAIVFLLVTTFSVSGFLSELSVKLLALLILNILPIITIAINCISMERKDENYLTRAVPFVMFVSIVISSLMTFLPLEDIGEGFASFLTNTYSILEVAHIFLFVISIILLIKPNNQITRIIKIVAIGALGINIAMLTWQTVEPMLNDALPRANMYVELNSFGGGGNTLRALPDTSKITGMIYTTSLIIEIFSLILLFITNYAFSSNVEIEDENLSIDELKDEANKVNQQKIENIYNIDAPKEINIEPDRSQSEKGLMNVNNQLGINSNVGQVKERAQTVNVTGVSVESVMPMSTGPIINEAAISTTPNNEQINNNSNQDQNTMTQQQINNQNINQ